ncbi:hypothetical protein NB705_000699 [Xanthomonas sacchari]|nr:hypothetical protein [Xanthomonas sacchari]
MAVVVHLHDLRQAACPTRDHAQRTPRDSSATCCGGPHRKVSLRLRRTAAVAACPVRAETASAATTTINASRLKPLPQESEVVRCRCHVGRMDSRRSGMCCCSGSAATFGLQRVAAEAVPTERATPHDAGAMSSPWIRAEAACAAARDQRRPCARHASWLKPLPHVHVSAIPERRANNILRSADTGQRRGVMRRRFSRRAWSAGSSARRSGRSGRAGFPASRCALLPIPGCRPGAGG